MRDKPKLVVSPVHPETYQVWLRLKDVQKNGQTWRRYVFLSYFSVANRGLRDVSVDEWQLRIKNRLRLIQYRHKKKELKPYNIPEPQLPLGDAHVKSIKAFGQSTQNYQSSSSMVKSGDSVSGMSCWLYSVCGHDRWDPETDQKNNIAATLKIRNIFGATVQCKIVFREFSIERLKKMIPTIGDYLENNDDFLI